MPRAFVLDARRRCDGNQALTLMSAPCAGMRGGRQDQPRRRVDRALLPPDSSATLRSRSSTMKSTVVGGAMLPHAPQFFTMPDTEDKANVERVRAVAADIGSKLRTLDPDLWII